LANQGQNPMAMWISQAAMSQKVWPTLANLLHYITVRSVIALYVSFAVAFFWVPRFIPWIRKHGSQPIRDDGPASHLVTKVGRATMGGIVILGAFLAAVVLCADLKNAYVWVVTGICLGFGMIGAVDDWLKLARRNHRGLPGRIKLACQVGIAGLGVAAAYTLDPLVLAHPLVLPFFKNFPLILPVWLMGLLAIFIIVGASNAVNLTDGLDGLAVGPVAIAAAICAIFSYVAGHSLFAPYLYIPFVPQAGEMAVLCAALIGACLGFLWYNAPPAALMMGDVGALALGGFLGAVAVLIRQEIMLGLAGALFVIEAVSVMIQVFIFRRSGRRIFLMAPLHHHFEKKGWAEPTVVMRFWIVALLFGLLAMTLLKVR
jgi:phospho-N-acetylmuramoyl-pentapeptide-transferase